MYAMRRWSARHSSGLKAFYHQLETLLVKLYPQFEKLGLQKIEKPLMFIEKPTKSFLFDESLANSVALKST